MEETKKSGSSYSILLGVAFVWFTTHFGGGFASGAQIYSYYVRYGSWCLIMPTLAMIYNAIFFAYCLYFARKHQVYDYRSYNNTLYGRFAPVFSNLFEVLYVCVMCVAPAVAFATGGATLSTLTGIPYLVCTMIIGVFIFIVAIFGTDLVRKVASVLSVCIIAGLMIVYIPNIISSWNNITSTATAMSTDAFPFGKALYSAFLYGTFQLANVAVFVQHAKSFAKPKDAVKSMGIGCVINILMMTMVVLGIMSVASDPDMYAQSVPTLFMVQKGVGSKFLTPLISILIILGAVSTAVNMVSAMVTRICSGVDKQLAKKKSATVNNTDANHTDNAAATEINETNNSNKKFKITRLEVMIAILCCIADFCIAQFGLLTLVQKAYSFLAYLAIPFILIPYMIRMILRK